eukprot:TRINITY_DN2661_c0_g1_i1.p1 TRINITY_DN2661_c0_g1~~TRINITY_DN2661_c0_g1_i1.p1  ORF type:complete len:217 (+),score=113.68 TRINITY_DN2661_c0_g1_i1:864-1514(+)
MANLRGVAGKYTRVLLMRSFELGCEEDVRRDLAEFDDTLKRSLTFRTNFGHLDMSLLPIHDVTRVFVEELRKNKHSKHLRQIAKDFERSVREVNNEKHITVTTAKELSEEEFNKVYDDLAKTHAPDGQELIVTTEVDPSIIGGMVVDTGEAMIDISVSAILDRWGNALKAGLRAESDARSQMLQREINKTSGKTGNAEYLAKVEEGVKELEKQVGW